ncbi:MAG: OmpA family protein [Bacteroidota bacterium]
MIGLIAILIVILLAVVVVQIGKVTELSAKIRGEEGVNIKQNTRQAFWLLVFCAGFLIFCGVSAYYYKNWMLGYGPHEAASAHGPSLDSMFNITLVLTGIVFVITHIALFWFTWKYRKKVGAKALFMPHNNMLEVVWTVIPAIVMTILVIRGLATWNEVMDDPGDEAMEIEAMGWQFAWNLRYPGADGVLGARDFRLTKAGNDCGQDWNDPKNHDDFMASDLVLPVDKKVRVRIIGRDVLHNFYLPHFRVKMDAVPGIPTYFVFTPTKTTEEYREELRKYPEYHAPSDPEDPNSDPLWKAFNYELACAELCGKGHYSMRKIVRIVEQDEYDEWLSEQQSHYFSQIRNTDDDPYKGQLLDVEIGQRKVEFNDKVSMALKSENAEDKIIRLEHVEFQTGSANLTELSKYEIENLANVLKQYSDINIELGGHTDNTGTLDTNMTLSNGRANAVKNKLLELGIAANRLTAIGYGPNRPIDTNDTDEGRQNNRRTEFKIVSQ